MKNFLEAENDRNKQNGKVYSQILILAFGQEHQTFIGHHLSVQRGGDLSTQNEIPSADTLMFDHEIMGRIFGRQAISCMRRLAEVPTEQRDGLLRHMLAQHRAPSLRGYMGHSWYGMMAEDDFIQIPLNVSARQPKVQQRLKDGARCILRHCRLARRRYRFVQWATTGLTWGSIAGGFMGYLSGFEALALMGAVIAGFAHEIDTWLLGGVEAEYHRELEG